MVIGIAGICAMGGDKLLAVISWDRISERTLHIIALLGGFWESSSAPFCFTTRHRRGSSGLQSSPRRHSGWVCSWRSCSATSISRDFLKQFPESRLSLGFSEAHPLVVFEHQLDDRRLLLPSNPALTLARRNSLVLTPR